MFNQLKKEVIIYQLNNCDICSLHKKKKQKFEDEVEKKMKRK